MPKPLRDGYTLVTGTLNGNIYIYDLRNLSLLNSLKISSDKISCINISKDKNYICWVEDRNSFFTKNVIYVFNLLSKKVVFKRTINYKLKYVEISDSNEYLLVQFNHIGFFNSKIDYAVYEINSTHLIDGISVNDGPGVTSLKAIQFAPNSTKIILYEKLWQVGDRTHPIICVRSPFIKGGDNYWFFTGGSEYKYKILDQLEFAIITFDNKIELYYLISENGEFSTKKIYSITNTFPKSSKESIVSNNSINLMQLDSNNDLLIYNLNSFSNYFSILNIEKGTNVDCFSISINTVKDFKFSAKNKRLATLNNNTVRVWDLAE
ncbi:MAG: hypothetical protein AAF849_23525 [Bacteroidota bacterium]